MITNHFARLFLDGSIETQLAHPQFIQSAHRYGRSEANHTQQRTWGNR